MCAQSTLGDRLYSSYQGWTNRLEQLVTHPIKYVKGVYSDTEIHKDIAATIAVATITVPLYAYQETWATGSKAVSDLVSIKTRAYGILINYILLSFGLEGREKLRENRGITHESAWYKRHLLDLAYAGTIIFPVRIAQYYAAGERNLGKLLINSAIGTAIGLAITVPMLWVVDSYKELVGLEETGRLPKWIREKPLKSRKRIAAVYSAVGLAAALAVYILNPIKAEEKKAIPQLNKSELHEIIHTAAGI